MAEIKTKFGKMACETCGEPVTVKSNSRGTLSYNCQECDAAPYARVGTIQAAHWTRKCGAAEPAPAAKPSAKPGPKPTPAPAPAPAQEPKPSGTFF